MMSCHYPTTIAAVDDDPTFLSAVGQHLGIAKSNQYTNPHLAIQQINAANPFERIKPRLLTAANLSADTTATADNYSITINPHRLHEEIYSATRFNDVSVIIVDYHMGDVTGIDVCRQLADHPAKKILLTGAADKEKIAIDAFNQGIIHRFIGKQDPELPLQLRQAVSILKENYFRDLTTKLMPYLPEANARILKNLAYVNFVKSLQLQLSANEYYLFDMSGSILFLNYEGLPTWLLIKSESELKEYEEIAANADDAEHILAAIKSRESIPFFLSETDFQQPAESWNDYLYPANPLPGSEGYYYSVIGGHVRDNLRISKIVTMTAHATKTGATSIL
jgi:CheY-like chemotaxis protein